MAHTVTTFMRCPDCLRKGVSRRWGRGSGDFYGCRYCEWYAYDEGYQESDVRERARLREVNPGDTRIPLVAGDEGYIYPWDREDD